MTEMANNMKERRAGIGGARLAAAVCILAAALAVSGCSPFKATPVSLLKTAVMNARKAESVATDADISGVFKLGQENLSLGMDVDMHLSAKMESIREPRLAKGTADLDFSVLGTSQSIHTDLYLEADQSGHGTAYMNPEGGSWKKKSVRVADISQEKGRKLDALLMGAEAVNMFLQDPLELQLDEALSEVNGREAYRITCKVPGSVIKKVLEKKDSDGEKPEGGISLKDVDWNKVLIPAEIYIYKAEKLPARIVMECETIGNQMAGKLLENALEDLPIRIEDLSLEAEKCTVDLVFDRYGKIEGFEIPEEIREGADAMDVSETGFMFLRSILGF